MSLAVGALNGRFSDIFLHSSFHVLDSVPAKKIKKGAALPLLPPTVPGETLEHRQGGIACYKAPVLYTGDVVGNSLHAETTDYRLDF